jgi:methylglutaconyl-CoA hydratase
MAYKTLKLENSGAVATLTLNRPAKLNAISAQMIEEILSALAEIDSSAALAMILTGEGNAFCSGMDLDDLKAMAQQSPERHIEDSRHMAQLYRQIWSFSKPTIAAVNGAAIAGGCGLATLCDFTVSASTATFGYPEVRIGFMPAVVSVFLTRQIGEKNARDLLLSGRTIDAAEAHRMGMITKVVPVSGVLNAAKAQAKTLLASSPASLLKTKKLLCNLSAPELDRELELAIAAGAEIRSTPDFREGLASFLEKRAPRWGSR